MRFTITYCEEHAINDVFKDESVKVIASQFYLRTAVYSPTFAYFWVVHVGKYTIH